MSILTQPRILNLNNKTKQNKLLNKKNQNYSIILVDHSRQAQSFTNYPSEENSLILCGKPNYNNKAFPKSVKGDKM